MECSVEHTYLWKSWHQLLYGAYTFEVCRVVQRSEVCALLEYLEHFVCKQHALVELLSSVYHAVSYGIDFLQVFDDADFWVNEQAEDELYTLCVLWNVVHHRLLLAVGEFHFHESSVESHTLRTTRCHYSLGVHVVESILDRRATTV